MRLQDRKAIDFYSSLPDASSVNDLVVHVSDDEDGAVFGPQSALYSDLFQVCECDNYAQLTQLL